nr:hypothetical protein [Tanacetum cinerariifolium]
MFDELMGTRIIFSAYVMNRHEYPFDLSKPISLIEDQGRQVVPADYFINNDLEYLKGGSLSSKYVTSTTKTKAAKYDNIEGIEDMVPTLWSLFKEGDFPRLNLCDIKDMLLLLVQKKLSNLDVDDRYDLEGHEYPFDLSKPISLIEDQGRQVVPADYFINNDLEYLKALPAAQGDAQSWIRDLAKQDDIYKFKEGDFKRLRLQDIEDMLLLLRRMEDLQLGVESYQKKLNLTRPDTYRSDLRRREAYTA